MIFVDSDNFFIRPFSFESFIRDGKLRLFRVPGEDNKEQIHRWYRTASVLLGLPLTDYFGARYIGNIITWRRSNVLALHDHIESVCDRPWTEAVCSCLHFSEWILYGVFVDQILKERAGHYADDTNICCEYWNHESLSDREISEFFQTASEKHAAAMISSKAGIPVSSYRHYIEKFSS